MVTPLKPTNRHSNIFEINHGITIFDEDKENMFEVRKNDPSGGFSNFKIFLPKIAEELYKVPEVKNLYMKRDQFHVVLVDALFNEVNLFVEFIISTKYFISLFMHLCVQ